MRIRITILAQLLVLLIAAMQFQASACETRTISPEANLNASAPFVSMPINPATWEEIRAAAELEVSIGVYDSLGERHTVRVFFFHPSELEPLEWVANGYLDGGDVGHTSSVPYQMALNTLRFNSVGDILLPEVASMMAFINWANGAAPQFITLQFDSVTQHNSASVVTSISQDGSIGACTQRGSLDFDGDGADDIGIWRPSLGIWAIRKSSTSGSEVIWIQWGLPGDQPMPGDYTGDKKADLVVWRPSNGNWYVCPSEANFNCSYASITQFGLPGDRPLKGDFDGDTILDPVVWRPNGGLFIYKSSRTEEVIVQQWGLPGDVPLGSGPSE